MPKYHYVIIFKKLYLLNRELRTGTIHYVLCVQLNTGGKYIRSLFRQQHGSRQELWQEWWPVKLESETSGEALFSQRPYWSELEVQLSYKIT